MVIICRDCEHWSAFSETEGSCNNDDVKDCIYVVGRKMCEIYMKDVFGCIFGSYRLDINQEGMVVPEIGNMDNNIIYDKGGNRIGKIEWDGVDDKKVA